MIPHASFYLIDSGSEDGEREWGLNCEICTRVGVFKGYLYKVFDHATEEGWVFLDRKVHCDLCMHDLHIKFGSITHKEEKP
jgi:hypothetical protein